MRKLSDIASEIRQDWRQVNFAAKPYLMAMMQLDSIHDNYMYDSGKMIVGSFLANSGSWRGDKAKAIKKELLAMMKSIREGEETERTKEKQDKEKEALKKKQEKEQEAARKKDFDDSERDREQKKREAERKKKLGIR